MAYILKNKCLEHFSEVRLQGSFVCKPEGFLRKLKGYYQRNATGRLLVHMYVLGGLLRTSGVGTSGASLKSCGASVVVDIQWKIQHLFKDITTIVGVITWNWGSFGNNCTSNNQCISASEASACDFAYCRWNNYYYMRIHINHMLYWRLMNCTHDYKMYYLYNNYVSYTSLTCSENTIIVPICFRAYFMWFLQIELRPRNCASTSQDGKWAAEHGIAATLALPMSGCESIIHENILVSWAWASPTYLSLLYVHFHSIYKYTYTHVYIYYYIWIRHAVSHFQLLLCTLHFVSCIYSNNYYSDMTVMSWRHEPRTV